MILQRKHGPGIGYDSPGYGDSQSSFTAVVRDKNGRETTRKVKMKYLENAPDGNKRLAVFEYPRDLKRLAYLTVSHKQGQDEQWLYDPETKQVQRIQSNNAFTPFSGLDITFEDISSQDVGKYNYSFVRNDTYNSQPVYVINRTPKDKNSGYGKLETWIDQASRQVVKIEYYDRANQHLKTMTLGDYQQFDNQYWRAMNIQVSNHQTGSGTEIRWDSVQYNTGLNANDFTPANLRFVN